MHNLAELLWASGLFEGEGCITYSGKGRATPRLILTTTDLDVLERFKDAIGFGRISKGRLPQGACKAQYTWDLTSFEKVQAVLAFLWYGLGERRKARARDILLEFRAKRPPTRKGESVFPNRTHCKHGHLWIPDNLRITTTHTGRIYRQCKLCQTHNSKRAYLKRKHDGSNVRFKVGRLGN